jgi:LDH2 family malate/lactate/ureidoglycolate dehydrogenase
VERDTVEVVVRPAELEQFVFELLRTAGMESDGAAFTARSLVLTNLWGIDSHGVLRVPAYVRALRAGAINGRARPRALRGTGAFAILDGDDGSGFVVGRAAMLHAIELAGQHGVGVVGAVNSNHFGAAGVYARLAADAGRIGIAMTNVRPNVVAPGGSRPVTGNNPLAIAVPTDAEFPFVLDMSCSTVAGGKLILASKKGERIPLDWATDREGRPTDDPDEGFAGFLLPMGGFKGLGLAYAIDILCGVVAGGPFGTDLKDMYSHPDESSKIGHLMVAIDTNSILSPDEMRARMATFTRMIKSSPMRNPAEEMILPGELEHRSALRRADGIPLPTSLYVDLLALAKELGTEASLDALHPHGAGGTA